MPWLKLLMNPWILMLTTRKSQSGLQFLVLTANPTLQVACRFFLSQSMDVEILPASLDSHGATVLTDFSDAVPECGPDPRLALLFSLSWRERTA